MAYKDRTERQELIILKSLNARMELSEEDKKNLYNLKKGYEGELVFDSMTEEIKSECFILNDLLLEVNKNKFQIDTLIIKDTLHLFDVKNNDGDYYYENGEFYYVKNGAILSNPLDQLKRCDSLFRQLLQKNGFRYPLESNIVYVNPEFMLYQSPRNQPIIFPSQLNSLMTKLNMPTQNLTVRHKQLADLLVSMHMVESPYPRLPPYEYGQLKKGVMCCTCQSLKMTMDGKWVNCKDCGHKEMVEGAVVRSVEELKLLFPDIKITTSLVMEWCGGIISRKTIRRALMNVYSVKCKGKYCYYE